MNSNHCQTNKSIGNYTLLTQEILGKGATGIVYKGVHNITQEPIAVKAIDLNTIRDEATKSLLENQKAALKAVTAPNVMKLNDIIEKEGFCYIITELCQGTTLKEYLSQKKVLSQNQAMTIFRKLTAGALAISNQCIIHRDLKPANVMIDNQGQIKIIDFGYCEIIMAKKVIKTFNVGSPSYMSPEAYQRTLYSQKSDAWSLGVILYEMLHGHTLDEGADIKRFFDQIKMDSAFITKRISSTISLQVKQIIEKALKYSTEERSTISNLKYLTDKYHVNLKEKNQNVYCSAKELLPMPKIVPKTPSPEVHSYRKVENQNNLFKNGFVTFADYSRQNSQKKGFIKMKQLTSLEDFDAESRRTSNSKGVAIDNKLNSFLNITVKQPREFKPSSTTNITAPMFKPPAVSVREISFTPQYPQYPPLYRHATVRFN